MRHLQGYLKRIRPRVEEEFARWIPEVTEAKGVGHTDIEEVFAAGKRIRACLVCLTSEALGGRLESAIPRAAAIECLHAASLIHDDFVDGDRMRRNQPAVWTLKGARQAVLLADVMFATAIHKMMSLGSTDGSLVAATIASMARGAYEEYRDASTAVSLEPETYDRIIDAKTGTLFAAAAKLGALAAGASTRRLDAAYQFGKHLGAAYQIADDLTEVKKLRRTAPSSAMMMPAPALMRFAGDHAGEIVERLQSKESRITDLSDAALRSITLGMSDEIDRRLSNAALALESFPANSATDLLQDLPAAVVTMQLAPNIR